MPNFNHPLVTYDNVSGEFGIVAITPISQNMLFWTENRLNHNAIKNAADRDAYAREIVRRWNIHRRLLQLVSNEKVDLTMDDLQIILNETQ